MRIQSLVRGLLLGICRIEVRIYEVIESLDAASQEDFTNSADDDFDDKINCGDTDCVKDPECIGGY